MECRTSTGVLDLELNWHQSTVVGERCVLPFVYLGITYSGCARSKVGYWCTTIPKSINFLEDNPIAAKNIFGGYCNNKCPKTNDIGIL